MNRTKELMTEKEMLKSENNWKSIKIEKLEHDLEESVSTLQAERKLSDELAKCLEPFARFSCNPSCGCFNCKAKDTLSAHRKARGV